MAPRKSAGNGPTKKDRPSDGRSFSGLVQDLLRTAEASYPDRSHRIWEVWEEGVGQELARRCQPVELRRGRLTVAACSSAWMQQLSFLREKIRETLNRSLGQELVREIRFRVAEVDPPRPRAPAPVPAWLSEDVEDSVRASIDEEVAAITDPVLKEAIRQVRVRAEQVRCYRARSEAPEERSPLPSSAGRNRPPRPRGGGPGAT